MVALEMARILRNDKNIHVAGLIMFDSLCPWSMLGRCAAIFRPGYHHSDSTRAEVRIKVDKAVSDAWRMITSWQCPASFNAPPMIMVRAKQTMYGLGYIFGSDKNLGWGSTSSVRFTEVLDVEGNHFSMFDASQVGVPSASYGNDIVADSMLVDAGNEENHQARL